ncbi:rod-binding protein [Phyllobacterium sp. SB3]|uniref:rod-binding protein n=1 Tax=Phyllobacterium sp. SB3 TaxID=3156073 RepID=UPI0032B01963
MAINPPSDLVLDVAMAANPQAMRTSTERLRSMSADKVAGQMPLSSESFARLQEGMNLSGDAQPKILAPNPAFKKFEAFMLQSFVESMFAGDNQAVYGEGIAGGYWKSMMSEAIANQMASVGGIGVARMLEEQSAKRIHNEAAEAIDTAPDIHKEQDSNAILYQIERQLIQKQLKSREDITTTRQS